MSAKTQTTLRPHEGWTGEVKTGQVLRITAKSMIDFNCFEKDNFKEYFDTARTRIYNLNMYPTVNHRLFSKQNNPMMKFIKDGFSGIGLHDLQSSHGCPDLMLKTLGTVKSMTLADLPDPMGLFRNLKISPGGQIKPSPKGPLDLVDIELKAEIDLVCALTNCPSAELSASGADCIVTIL